MSITAVPISILRVLSTDPREQWKRCCQLPREVMNTKVGSVHSEALGLHVEVNGLQECVSLQLRS